MKVVHICNLPLSLDHPDHGRLTTHPGRWVLNLAIAQKEHTDIEPELLVQIPGASRDHHTSIEGIPVHFIAAPNRLRAATLFYFDIRRVAAGALALRPDLVHAHGTEDCYALAALHTRLPNVITAQGLYFVFNALFPPKLLSRERIVEFTERCAFRRARHVVAKSAYVADALQHQFPHLTLHRIPNTFDARLMEINAEKEQHLLVFIGTVVHRKGLDLIADALAKVQRTVPEVRLWVFGDQPTAPSEYQTRIKATLSALLGKRVTFHGILPALDVAHQLARATALVAPSREEMFGNQLIEALVLRTHGIVTDGTALAENVRLFGNGSIVPQEDPQSLAEAIRAILTKDSLSNTESARHAVIDAMGPKRVAGDHFELYRAIVNSSN